MLELKPCASGLKGRNDLADVVTNKTESCIFGVLFYNSSQGKLSCCCHGITLIENNELYTLELDILGTSELLNGISDHIDTSCIWGIELQSHLIIAVFIHHFSAGDDSGGLSCTWRPIKEKIGKLLFFNEFIDGADDWFMRDELVEVVGTIFLDPGKVILILLFGFGSEQFDLGSLGLFDVKIFFDVHFFRAFSKKFCRIFYFIFLNMLAV